MNGREVESAERFPGENPNPVLRMTEDGLLIYANAASEPLRPALGAEVGERIEASLLERLTAGAADNPPTTVEVVVRRRTFAVLAVHVPDLRAYNLYGTDITAAKVVERFPNQNPNPVLRMTPAGDLLYANDASRPIIESLGIRVGDPLPADLFAAFQATLADPSIGPPEVAGEGGRTYLVTPVPIPEFEFVNLYGTDITAARQVELLSRANEQLLLNILPPSIAARLRGGEMVIADRFDEMAVLFADVVGFTELSSRLAPTEVVSLLNDVFSACDRLADHFHLEKIKTVGDAYMVVGGLQSVYGDEPDAHAGNAADVAAMGLAIVDEVERLGRARGVPMEVRVGMHVGPAVAGVIGLKKFIYDVWGDTVNTASRMESTGIPGRLQVTRETRDRLDDAFSFERRGLVDVKGKGQIETWFVTAPRPAGDAGG